MNTNQDGGQQVEVIESLRCSNPFPYIFRQTRAETAFDFQPLQLFSEIPYITIEENMRVLFATGEDFRIHSVNRWPVINSRFLEIVLQGDGNA